MRARLSAILAAGPLLTGCVLTPTEPHRSASGLITGCVLDASGHPVARAHVTAVYKRAWTWVIPPVPNWLVVGESYTDATGQFRIATSKRVDALSSSATWPGGVGGLNDVANEGNVVRLR